MPKISKLNQHHLISNSPKEMSFFKRVIGQIAFSVMVTKVTKRKNYLTKDDYHNAVNLIQKGDVILVGGFRFVSGIFLGKLFTHSLLYQGNSKCIHASVDGVATIKLEELFSEYDNLAILRPKIGKDAENVIDKAVTFAREQIGKPYDFYFEHVYDRHYCTLLISSAFSQAGFDIGLKKYKNAKKAFLFIRIRQAIKADSLLRGNFNLILLSESLKNKRKEIAKINNKQNKNI